MGHVTITTPLLGVIFDIPTRVLICCCRVFTHLEKSQKFVNLENSCKTHGILC